MPQIKVLKTNVRRTLNDLGVVSYKENDLNASFQDAYDEVVSASRCIEKSTNYPYLDNTLYYDFYDSIPDFLSLVGVYSYTMRRWLAPTSPRELDQVRYDWERWNGNPKFVTPINYRYHLLLPWPTKAQGVFLMLYNARASKISDDMIPQMPDEYGRLLEYYVTADLLESNREFNKAAVFQEKYFKDLLEFKDAAKKKNLVDRIFVLEPYIPFGRYAGTFKETWVDNEVPSGVIDGTNTHFDLKYQPSPTQSLLLFKNGQMLYDGLGFILQGNSIFFNSGYVPSGTDEIRAWYRIA